MAPQTPPNPESVFLPDFPTFLSEFEVEFGPMEWHGALRDGMAWHGKWHGALRDGWLANKTRATNEQ